MRCYKCKWNTLVRTDNAICPRKSFCKKEDDELYNKWNDKIKIGSKIYFDNEKHGYKVRARDKRFVIAYRNWKDTYYYVIVDLYNTKYDGGSKKSFIRIEKNENNLKFIKQFWDKPIKNN